MRAGSEVPPGVCRTVKAPYLARGWLGAQKEAPARLVRAGALPSQTAPMGGAACDEVVQEGGLAL